MKSLCFYINHHQYYVDRTSRYVSCRCPCHVTRDVAMPCHVRVPVAVAKRCRDVTGWCHGVWIPRWGTRRVGGTRVVRRDTGTGIRSPIRQSAATCCKHYEIQPSLTDDKDDETTDYTNSLFSRVQ